MMAPMFFNREREKSTREREEEEEKVTLGISSGLPIYMQKKLYARP